VNDCTSRDVTQRQCVPNSDVSGSTRLNHVVNVEADRLQDIPLLAVEVVQQSNASISVWVVLNRGYPSRDPILVATEVDNPIGLLVTTTAVPTSDSSIVVTATG
jgi:hypothetical protein